MCSGCRSVKYCSAECQKLHWKSDHKKACKILLATKEEAKAKKQEEKEEEEMQYFIKNYNDDPEYRKRFLEFVSKGQF